MVRLSVSCRVGQATLRSSERTSRMKFPMSAKGLPVRRPPRPDVSGSGEAALLLLLPVAVPRLPPRLPAEPTRFDPARAGFDWLLLVWATGHPFTRLAASRPHTAPVESWCAV